MYTHTHTKPLTGTYICTNSTHKTYNRPPPPTRTELRISPTWMAFEMTPTHERGGVQFIILSNNCAAVTD